MTAGWPDMNRPATLLQEHMAAFGYQLLETPVIADAGLFLTRAGDRIVSRLFTFNRGGRALALRPEFTSMAAHRYVEDQHRGVQRWQFSGPVFEQKPQGGSREYQRYSVGAELFGLPGPAADAEIMALAVTGLQGLEVSDWRLVVGHIGLMRRVLAQFELDERTERFLIGNLRNLRRHGKDHVLDLFDGQLPGMKGEHALARPSAGDLANETALAELLQAIQHGSAMGGRDHSDIARRLLRTRQRLSERDQVVEALEVLDQWCQLGLPAGQAFEALASLTPAEALPTLKEWEESITLLRCYGLSMRQVVIQPDLARNWDYYSGMVFELHDTRGRHLGGGGRYDDLLKFMGAAPPVPAVGFACWLDRLRTGQPEATAGKRFAVLLDRENGVAATRLAQLLRAQGLATELTNVAREDALTCDPDGRVRWRGNIFSLDRPASLLEALTNG